MTKGQVGWKNANSLPVIYKIPFVTQIKIYGKGDVRISSDNLNTVASNHETNSEKLISLICLVRNILEKKTK